MKAAAKLIFLISLFFPFLAFSQQPNGQPGNIYVSPEGKLFVKSKTPIYLRLAVSPDENAGSYLLRNQASQDVGQAPGPFHFEGHGTHTIKHMADHRVPQKNADNHVFYVHDDGKAPKSKISVTKAPWVYNGNVNIYGKPVSITLEFYDADSGVFAGLYGLNSDTFSRYAAPLSLETEGDYKLQYYALDNVSNQSKNRVRYYALDFTPPETQVKIVGGHLPQEGEDILSPKSKIVLESHDKKAGVKQVRYRFKGKREIFDKQKPLTMDGLPDGSHKLIFAAEDRVQNQEANHTFSFYLDSIPPVAMDELVGDQYTKGKNQYVSGRTSVRLTATDNKAGVKHIRYYFNDKNSAIYSAPFNFPPKNGKAGYSYKAVDNVLNIGSLTTKEVIVDISAPKIDPRFIGEHYFSRQTHYVRLSTKIDLPTTDNLSGVKGVQYKIGETPSVFNPGPFSLSTEGEHVVGYQAVDNVNNETEEYTMKLFVDEKAPEIYHHFSVNPTDPARQTYPLKSLLYLAATDIQAGIRNIFYSINGAQETPYKKPLSFKTKQSYSIKIRAIDNVGNVSTDKVEFEIQ